ncbi:MAG TPA: YhcH/YjgK/YiaL family protein [Clostridia bacterium]|nr:YhcH/YjgK/YiaL family protein [Clostridia bacterium]
MVIDRIENINLYEPLLDCLPQIQKFLTSFEKEPCVDGRYELDGEKLFALVQRFETKPAEGRLPEAHRKYIDLQLVISGEENIGWAPLPTLKEETEEFSKGGDIGFYSGDIQIWATLKAGHFALLYPEDAHLPCTQVHGPSDVCKVVFKILM